MFKKLAISSGILAQSVHLFAACPAGTTEVNATSCRLSGTYTSDLNLTADKTWLLNGGVFIGNDAGRNATLNIAAGTIVKGESGADYLVISRGSKIEAKGTATKPIVFTTDNKVRGGWGGLIINGAAPINGCTTGVCQAEGEGSTGLYGGSNPADSSGTLRYVRVEFAGFQITPENELNGIAFQGVGSGTTVEFIQSHMGADDGIEFFGGNVNVKNVVVTGARDDSMDWVNGWNGKGQYIVIKQYDDEANHGIEADNLGSNHAATPRSLPQLSNLTMIGTASENAEGGSALLLRRGTGLHLYNSAIKGFKKACINLDDNETFAQATSGSIAMKAVVVDCAAAFAEVAADPFKTSTWFLGQDANKQMNGLAFSRGFLTTAMNATTPVTPDDLFFDEVDFVGAVKDDNSDWTKGWTVGL